MWVADARANEYGLVEERREREEEGEEDEPTYEAIVDKKTDLLDLD